MVTQLEKATTRLYTVEEFEALTLPDDEATVELIDGEIIMTPPAGEEHGIIATKIIKAIARFDPEDKLGRVVIPTWFKLGSGFAPAPDVAFTVAEKLKPAQKGPAEVIPDLVVEVWSPSDLDTQAHRERNRLKVRKYQNAGVRIVWAINPQNKTVEVYHPNQAEPVAVLKIEDELSGEEVLPDFKLPVKKLFED